MNKILRYSFVALMAMVFAGSVMADDDVIIDFNALTDQGVSYSANQSQGIEASTAGDITTTWTKTFSGVTVEISPKTSGNNENRFWKTNNGPQLRCYSGTITLKATKAMKAIIFEANGTNFNLETSAGSLAEKTWTGDATEVVFTVKSNTQLNKITVNFSGGVTPPASIANTAETAYTVAKAHELIDAGEGLSATVYVKGIVSQIDDISTADNVAEGATAYGNATYYISDDGTTTNQLEVYRGKGLNGNNFTAKNQLAVGDQVIVYGTLVAYGSAKVHEFNQNSGIYSSTNSNLTSGVAVLKADVDANAPAYNVAGQKVEAGYKGLVIKGGKKFVNK